MEKFGRRKSILFDSSIYILGTLLGALSPNFYVLLASRVILGHSTCSSMAAVPVYTSEISEAKVRTITGCFNVVCFTFGFAVSLIFGNIHYNILKHLFNSSSRLFGLLMRMYHIGK